MSTSTYTWTVMSINEQTRSMLVQYQAMETSKVFNIPVPPSSENLSNWVDKFAPRDQWREPEPIINVLVGQTGVNPIENALIPYDVSSATSITNTRLRVLIYEIMQEIENDNI